MRVTPDASCRRTTVAHRSRSATPVAVALALLLAPATTEGQRTTGPTTTPRLSLAAPTRTLDSLVLAQLRWREIGPYRGGRSVAVAGSVARPNEYYMGTTGGGVFKTLDAGHSWGPVTDRYFGGTIGAIEVAASNPDIVTSAAGSIRFAATSRTATACGRR